MMVDQLVVSAMCAMLAEHVTYDVKMMARAHDAIYDQRSDPDPVGSNMALESYLIHARNLLEFYYPGAAKHRRRGHVYAFCFLQGGEDRWELLNDRTGFESRLGHDVREIHNAISTRIGHVSIDRLNKVGWVLAPISGELLHTSTLFRDALRYPYRQAWDFGLETGPKE